MIYLSRLLLNLHNHQARVDLADVQQMHRTILNAFPLAPDSKLARQHFGVLFRMESVPDQPLVARVLVQSTFQPNWSHLVPGYLAAASDRRGNPAVRTLDDDYARLAAGTLLRFRLRANPTQRIGMHNHNEAERWRGKRVELRDEQAQLAWLQRKSEQGGFQIVSVAPNVTPVDVQMHQQPNVVGERSKQRGHKPMTFGATTFEGHLSVQNVNEFREALVDGIGSGKAYGFGLLSIAAARGGGV